MPLIFLNKEALATYFEDELNASEKQNSQKLFN